MCAHLVCKVTLPGILGSICDVSFITELCRRCPSHAQRWDTVPLRGVAPAISFDLLMHLEKRREKRANKCAFSVFFVEKMVYCQ